MPTFDGIRGLVSLSIALVHVQLAVQWVPAHEGIHALRGSWYFSIEFLFLLGGFVAFLPLAYYGRFAGIRSYALRRAGRILPLYYLTLVLGFVFGGPLRSAAVGIPDSLAPHGLEALLAHAFFLQQEVFRIPGFGVLGIVWTMSIAAGFYVLFPLVARAYLRWPVLGLATAIAVSVAWRKLVPGTSRAYLQFPLFLLDFAIGMTAAQVYVWVRRRGGIGPREALGLAAAGLVALGVLLYLAGLPVAHRVGLGRGLYWHEGVAPSIAVPAVFAAVLVVAPFLPRWARWPIDNPVARWVGQVSYGLFLFHFLVIWTVLAVTDLPRDGTQASVIELTLLVIPLSLLLGWLGTRFVERPLRERAQRLAALFRSHGGTGLERPVPAPSPTK